MTQTISIPRLTGTTLDDARSIAQGAARSALRKLGKRPEDCSFDDAQLCLEDLAYSQPDLIASIWYRHSSEHQLNLFRREWNRWRAAYRLTMRIDDHTKKMFPAGTIDPAQQAFIDATGPMEYHCEKCGISHVKLQSTCNAPLSKSRVNHARTYCL